MFQLYGPWERSSHIFLAVCARRLLCLLQFTKKGGEKRLDKTRNKLLFIELNHGFSRSAFGWCRFECRSERVRNLFRRVKLKKLRSSLTRLLRALKEIDDFKFFNVITAANERPWQLNWNCKICASETAKRCVLRISALEWVITFHSRRLGHASFTFFSRVHKVYYPPWEWEAMGILSWFHTSRSKNAW